jgi:hypothetical protein
VTAIAVTPPESTRRTFLLDAAASRNADRGIVPAPMTSARSDLQRVRRRLPGEAVDARIWPRACVSSRRTRVASSCPSVAGSWTCGSWSCGSINRAGDT